MNKWIACLVTAALALTFATGCGNRKTGEAEGRADGDISLSLVENEEPTDKLKVVSTIFPPYDFVREIAGDRVELSMLLSPGAESHSFEPTPQDIITIQNCDVFLYVGGDSDNWVDRILESMDTSGMTIIPLLDLVDVVEEEMVEGMEHSHDDHDHEHDEHDHDNHDDGEREYDEHVWTSPKNAMTIVQALSNTLCGLDSDNGEFYRENTASYLTELERLDGDFTSVVSGAQRSTLVFGDRFPFRYLADAYGLDYYAAFPGCSTETEASAGTVAFLIDKVREEHIPTVFFIEFSNEKMADTICESTGAEKLLLHSCHNVSKDDFENGENYLSLMARNVEHLKEALH